MIAEEIPQTWKPSPITRDAAHRYTYEGVTYPGVTTILNALDKSGPLMGWAARETAKAAVELMKQTAYEVDGTEIIGGSALWTLRRTVGDEGVIKALTARSSWTRDEAAQLGTEVHALADLVVHGKPLPATMTDTQRKRVEHYARWWEASKWRVRLSEAMVVNPGTPTTILGQDIALTYNGWGGTFDLLAFDQDGRTVLADIKTGKAVYKEAALQLAAYGMASLVQPAEAAQTYPMPVPDRYVILHVTGEGVREVEISIGTPEHMAFLACLDLHHWIESMKGKRF